MASAASSLDDDDVSLTLEGLNAEDLDADLRESDLASDRATEEDGDDGLCGPAGRAASPHHRATNSRGTFLGRMAARISTITALTGSSFGNDDDEEDDDDDEEDVSGRNRREQRRRHGVRGHDAARFGRDDERRRATFFRKRSTMMGPPRRLPSSASDDPGTSSEACGSGGNPSRSLRRLASAPPWRGLICLSIAVVIFGPPLNDMARTPSADAAVDALLTVCMVFLGADILVRCASDPAYFHFRRRGTLYSRPSASVLGRGGTTTGTGHRRDAVMMGPEENGGNCCRGFVNVHAGSFMFYCDVVGTLSTLYRISYVNPDLRHPAVVVLPLTALGMPSVGYTHLPHHGTRTLGYIDWGLLLTVGRVGLMARFIRTSVLVEMSSGFPYRYFYPAYWLRVLCRWCVRNTRKARGKVPEPPTARPSDLAGAGSLRSEPGGMRSSFSSSSALSRRRSSAQRSSDPASESMSMRHGGPGRASSQRGIIIEGDDESASWRGDDEDGPAGQRSMRDVIRDGARAVKSRGNRGWRQRARGLGSSRKTNESSSHVGEFLFFGNRSLSRVS